MRVVDIAPAVVQSARGWDLGGDAGDRATTIPTGRARVKMGRLTDGSYLVMHATFLRGTPAEVERPVLNISSQDGYGMHRRPAAGSRPGRQGQIAQFVRLLAGYPLDSSPETGDKITRFSPFSAQAEAGNILVLRGDWNERWFQMLEGFPELPHDDEIDATSQSILSWWRLARSPNG